MFKLPFRFLEYDGFCVQNEIFLIPFLFLVLFLLLYLKWNGRKLTKSRLIFFLIRVIILLLIFLAISESYLIKLDKKIENNAEVVFLDDISDSMKIFEDKVAFKKIFNDLMRGLEGIPILSSGIRYLEFGGNHTSLGDILEEVFINSKKNNLLIILRSDGNSNYGKDPISVAKFLVRRNVTLVTVIPTQSSEEVYLSAIEGRSIISGKKDGKIKINVKKIGNFVSKCNIEILVNGKTVIRKEIKQYEENKAYEFSLNKDVFIEGDNTIKVILRCNKDTVKENNILMKVIKVEKPKVLVITKTSRSPLLEVINDDCDVTIKDKALKNLNFDEYEAAILDNLNSKDLEPEFVYNLENYILNGNGLLVVGGDNSFDKGNYSDSRIETLLPVISIRKPRKERKPIAVLFCIDVSASMGYKGERGYKSYLDESKAIAINILRQLNDNDYAGVLAFNVPAFEVVPLVKIKNNRKSIEKSIMMLKPAEGGGTDFFDALNKADRILSKFSLAEGGKYIIFLSDGYPNWYSPLLYGLGMLPEESVFKSQIKKLAERNIKIYAVSVGDRAQARSAKPLMQDMAKLTNGKYFWMEEDERLRLMFKKEKKDEGIVVEISDYTHFITKDLGTFRAKIIEYNTGEAKKSSQVLLATYDEDPILVVWRYGLGRVAALLTDNGNSWAFELYQNSSLISNLISWIVGDLERGKIIRLRTHDFFIGGDNSVYVIINAKSYSNVTLESSSKRYLESKELPLREIHENIFSSRLSVNKPDFYEIVARVKIGNEKYEEKGILAVNYPVEYRKLGINKPLLEKLSMILNGYVIELTQENEEILKNFIIKYLNDKCVTYKMEKIPISYYLLLLAFAIFFIDAILRRGWEILQLRRRI